MDERHIVAAIGPVRLERLRAVHVEHLWKSMVDAGRVGSVPHCRRTLMATLNEAVQRGLLAHNPVKLASTPRVESPAMKPYTVEEMCQFLNAAEGTRNAPRSALPRCSDFGKARCSVSSGTMSSAAVKGSSASAASYSASVGNTGVPTRAFATQQVAHWPNEEPIAMSA